MFTSRNSNVSKSLESFYWKIALEAETGILSVFIAPGLSLPLGPFNMVS